MPSIEAPGRVTEFARSRLVHRVAAATLGAALILAPAQGLEAQARNAASDASPATSPAASDASSDGSNAPAHLTSDLATTPAANPTEEPITDPTEEITISGEHPGPGLWKVTYRTHVLWIFGSINPAPKNMTWHSSQVESIVASSKAVFTGESVSPNIGFFRGLTLLPSVLRLRFNPDKAVLKDLIAPEVYERWRPLRKRYFKDDADIEKVRPMFIAMMLYEKAIERAGLTRDDGLYGPIFKTAKAHDVPVKEIQIRFDIDNPRQKLRDYASTPRDRDVDCLVAAIDHLDGDVAIMQKRANAWATGDIEALRALPVPVQESACTNALTSAPALQDELGSLKDQIFRKWLDTTEIALAKNDVSFMMLPIGMLLNPDGRLAKLRERGYEVEGPTN